MSNPWAKAKQINEVHRRLMQLHPMKENRTADEETEWNTNIALYEDLLGKKLIRGNDGRIELPFSVEGV